MNKIEFSDDYPKCKHGPTFLFEINEKKYFACSACRDRQECQIYIPFEEFHSKKSKNLIRKYEKQYENFKEHIQSIQNTRLVSPLKYCFTCSILISNENQDHLNHDCSQLLDKLQLEQPCRYLLQPLENKRSNAQYYFSQTFIDYLINKIIMNNQIWDSIICIGCPTIFENLPEKTFRKFLLDYDERFCSFYSNKQMLIYNMFNGHRFSDEKYFQEQFLNQIQHCLIIIDPPFGGSHRALAYSIEKFFQSKIIQRNYLLFNPYFLEKSIQNVFPNLNMLDYKIDYQTNSSMNLCKGKKGSPVRIFTDLCPSKCPPLDDNNYKYCFECNRYTLLTNQHCYQCQSCTSKDGLPYRHCFECQRCVKANRKHCQTCSVCHLIGQCMMKSNKRKIQLSDKNTKKIK